MTFRCDSPSSDFLSSGELLIECVIGSDQLSGYAHEDILGMQPLSQPLMIE